MKDINALIDECGFCSVQEHEFSLRDNQFIKYFCCKRCLKKDKCNYNCDKCKEVFARYIVIDLTDEETLQICNEYVLKSDEVFLEFQNENISNIFFYETELVRYNIYLIFVCERPNIDKYISFSQNMDYARKLFLTKNDFEKYFNVLNDIYDNQNKLSRQINSNDSIAKLEENLEKYGMSSLLYFPESGEETSVYKAYSYIISDYDRLDEFYTSSKTKRTKQTNNNEKYDYSKNYIKTITLDSYRTNIFEKNTKIQSGLFNLFYGDNAGGKTSILDAIELGCTGSILNNKDNSSLVTILWDNNTAMNSEEAKNDRDIIKDKWYPFDMGDLNELFRQVNYFNIDATFNFALKPDAFELNKLFCDSEIIRIKRNLTQNQNDFDFVTKLFYFEKNDWYNKTNFKSRLLKFIIRFIPFFAKKKEETKKYLNNYIIRQPIKLKELKEANNYAINHINSLIESQISSNMELINRVFSRLFSYNYIISSQSGNYLLSEKNSNIKYSINEMSTAQRVCLALSLIFAKFLLSKDAPRFILLDESVANLDSLHLLNLLDFLRDASLKGIQIYFTTANYDVYKITKSKFSFLGDKFHSYELSKNEDGKAIIKKNCS